MSSITIHDLPAAPPLVGTEELPVQVGASTRRTTTQDVANLVVVPVGPPGPAGPPGPTGPGGPAGPAGPNALDQGTTAYTGAPAVPAVVLVDGAGFISSQSPGAAGQVLLWDGFNISWSQQPATAVGYTAGGPGNWTGPPPVLVSDALDRLAAWIVTNFPGPPPP